MGRMFGTDGVRGIANKDLTSAIAYDVGRTGAFVLTEGVHKPKILVGKDTRISSDMLEASLVAGILSVGAEAVILGVVPTPAVAYLTRKYKADAGVMISGAHNPLEYNGIKFFDSNGYKLSDELEDRIQNIIENGFEGIPEPTGADLGREVVEKYALEDYIEFAKSTINGDLYGLKVALDCANGACYKASVDSFRKLGAEVLVINNDPDGTNINKDCGSIHPEELMNYVVRKECDLGLAFDGDAARCLAVDEKGNLIDGDFIMSICGKYLKDEGRLKDDTIVTTVMSNLGMELGLNKEQIKSVKTKVGDRYVLEEMLKMKCNLGGEQSGDVIFLDFNTTGDGLVTGLQLASIVKKSGKTLSELASIMKKLPQVLVNITVPFDKMNIYITDEEISNEIKNVEQNLLGSGRVLIRPSGTEPLVRIMLEGENQEEIEKMADGIANLIAEKIK